MGLFGGLGKGSDVGTDSKDEDNRDKQVLDESADDKDKSGEGVEGKGDDKGNQDKDKKLNIQAIIENAVAEVAKGLKADNEAIKTQVSELMKKGLTPEQLKEFEDKEKEDAHNKREAEITERENRFYAITAIKKAGLDDGGETALELIDLVMGKDEKEIDLKVKSLSNLVKKMVAAEVDKTFKNNGRSPESGKGADGEDKNTDIAKKLGKRTAEANKQARSVLDSYIGGKK